MIENNANAQPDDTNRPHDAEKNDNNKIKASKKLIALIIAAAVLLAVIIGTGIYCVVTEQSPVSAAKSIFTSNKEEICAKWQNQQKPGLNAFVFYDDGTYDSYLSSFNFDGTYTIDGNKIKLTNPNTKKDLLYKFSIRGDVLIMTLIEEDGKVPDEETVTKYDKVDELNMKSLSDLIGELATTTTAAKQ